MRQGLFLGSAKMRLTVPPVLDLRLINRKDVGNTVVLFYLFKGKFRTDKGHRPRRHLE